MKNDQKISDFFEIQQKEAGKNSMEMDSFLQ